MDGSVDQELVGWFCPEGSRQWLNLWMEITSGVPQGPILGPVHFHVKHTLSKLLGDSKLGGAVHMPEGGMPSKGMWTSLRSGFTWMSSGWTRSNARWYTWVRTAPGINKGWGQKGLRADLRRTWGYWCMKNWIWAGSVHLQARKPATSWVASKTSWTAGWMRGFSLSALLYQDPTSSSASSSGILSTGKTWI